MEQTLGKRISALRKSKKMTQDQLADQLGVTAQAVSKWENDQSCPDITMLPRLAEIFGCTTDELLGIDQPQKVHEAEIVTREDMAKEDGLHITRGGFELKLDNDTRKGSIGIAVLILAVGGLLLLSHLLNWAVSFWSILWPTTLVVLGLFGTMPRSVFLRLGFVLFGGYFLLDNLDVLQFDLGWGFVLPVIFLFQMPAKAVALTGPCCFLCSVLPIFCVSAHTYFPILYALLTGETTICPLSIYPKKLLLFQQKG